MCIQNAVYISHQGMLLREGTGAICSLRQMKRMQKITRKSRQHCIPFKKQVIQPLLSSKEQALTASPTAVPLISSKLPNFIPRNVLPQKTSESKAS